jgi:hypothetical protein
MKRTHSRTVFQPRYKANIGKFKKSYPGLYLKDIELDAI